MAQRTFRVKSIVCLVCKNPCKLTGIERDRIYQSLGNAKLYVELTAEENEDCMGGLFEVEEELES